MAPSPSVLMATQVEPLLPTGAPLLQAEEHHLARKKPAPEAQAWSPQQGERESLLPPAAAEAPAGREGKDCSRHDFLEAPQPKVNNNPWRKPAPLQASVNRQQPPEPSAPAEVVRAPLLKLVKLEMQSTGLHLERAHESVQPHSHKPQPAHKLPPKKDMKEQEKGDASDSKESPRTKSDEPGGKEWAWGLPARWAQEEREQTQVGSFANRHEA